jgi:hypothetical protein
MPTNALALPQVAYESQGEAQLSPAASEGIQCFPYANATSSFCFDCAQVLAIHSPVLPIYCKRESHTLSTAISQAAAASIVSRAVLRVFSPP